MAVNRGRNKKVIIGGAVTGILVLLAVAVSAGFVDRFLKKSPVESAKAAGVVEAADTFGDAWTSYAACTPAFVPHLGRKPMESGLS